MEGAELPGGVGGVGGVEEVARIATQVRDVLLRPGVLLSPFSRSRPDVDTAVDATRLEACATSNRSTSILKDYGRGARATMAILKGIEYCP